MLKVPLKVAISAVVLSTMAGVACASSCVVVRKAGPPWGASCDSGGSAYPGVGCPPGWTTANSWTSKESGVLTVAQSLHTHEVNCVSYAVCCELGATDVVQTALLATLLVIAAVGLLIWWKARRTAGSRPTTTTSKIYVDDEEGLLELNVNR